jgi:phage tail sheath protein FI|tara:strand:- start:3809 stop:5755 length:1947 start_codon:yes stop_codon:yes gene_type:complete
MAFSVSPSVIVREVDASASVPAIATPPAAIAGVFRWGPVGEAILLSSENELVNRYGSPDDTNYETFFTAADYLSYSNALYVARVDNGATHADTYTRVTANNVTTTTDTSGAFKGLYPGELGNSLEIAYVRSEAYEGAVVQMGEDGTSNIPTNKITGNTDLTHTIAFNSANVSFEVSKANKLPIADIDIDDVFVIGNNSVGYQNIPVASIAEEARNAGGTVETDDALIAAYSYDITFNGKYTLPETSLNKLKIDRKWAWSGLFAKKPQDGNYHIAVIDQDGAISGAADSVLELYTDVSTTTSAKLSSGKTNYYKDIITQESAWVQVANTAHFEANTSTSSYESLAGAVAGRTESDATLADLAGGYDLFKSANEIDVSFVLQGKGDSAGNLATYIISNVADYRKDCIAFISPASSDVVDESKTEKMLSNVIDYRNSLPSSSYSVIDSGYKYRYDRYNDVYRYTPLNGDVAGLASRVEAYESPAGFRKGVIKNVVKLAFNPNKAQRDQLYSNEVNPVMSQVGQGIVLFGDKTGLGQNSAFDRINVRRLFIAVEKSIANAAQSFLFELNDEFTQAQFKGIVEPFLRDIQGRRGIVDFRVISDATVNTPAVIDQGKFRANIFIKPARSINNIELTFVATRSGVEFEEIVGSLT